MKLDDSPGSGKLMEVVDVLCDYRLEQASSFKPGQHLVGVVGLSGSEVLVEDLLENTPAFLGVPVQVGQLKVLGIVA